MKQIDFLGYTVDVVEDSDVDEMLASGEPSVYSMIRVADADPLGGSPELRQRRQVKTCEDCGASCWFDPKSYAPIARLRPDKICLQCTSRRALAEQDGE